MAERSRVRRKHIGGFTLIEILAVVVIVGIVTAVALISVKATGGRTTEGQTAVRLAGLIELASDNARLENRQYGLRVKPHHYEFLRFNDKGAWLPITSDPVLARHSLPGGMKMSITTEQTVKLPVASSTLGPASASASADSSTDATAAGTAPHPQVAILSTGEITPFTLRLTVSGGKTYLIRGGASGRVHVVPPGSVNGPLPVRYQH